MWSRFHFQSLWCVVRFGFDFSPTSIVSLSLCTLSSVCRDNFFSCIAFTEIYINLTIRILFFVCTQFAVQPKSIYRRDKSNKRWVCRTEFPIRLCVCNFTFKRYINVFRLVQSIRQCSSLLLWPIRPRGCGKRNNCSSRSAGVCRRRWSHTTPFGRHSRQHGIG